MNDLVFYNDGITPVELGDVVEFRGGPLTFFRKLRGSVVYVPGLSPFNKEMQSGVLRWIAIDVPDEMLVRRLVDPDTKSLVHSTRLLSRGTLVTVSSTVNLSDESDN